MKVNKTIELEMTDKERDALETVYRMLYNLSWDEEKALANELGYGDLADIRTDLATLHRLGGGCEEDLE